ncbi:MAG TPA: MopE-related protein, partial [Sphingomonas sanguinis]|uniref:MopE-related protein n=1 Tax=Sphingomonas sanguinis TaxID=33051 RepID=UPI002AC20681|nr:MopE-related protein [Sphingomonas sanguinis]
FVDLDGDPATGCEYACLPSNDGVEVCDALDNDCDGTTDEGLVRVCGSDVGACSEGQATCLEGEWGACEGDVEPIPEVCDGEDNDCNGMTDEGFADLDDAPDDAFEDTNCDGIDGDVADAVFLSPGGDDAAEGRLDAPVASFARAQALARAAGKYILAAEGEYSGRVRLLSGVRIYGGYRVADGWQRSDEYITAVLGDDRGLIANRLDAPTVVDRLQIRARSINGFAQSSYGLFIVDSADHLRVTNTAVIAGDGGPGLGGQGGQRGDSGLDGTSGSNGCDSQQLGVLFGCDRQAGDGARTRACGMNLNAGGGGSGGSGGNGGAGARGASGQNGDDVANSAGGDGGAGG